MRLTSTLLVLGPFCLWLTNACGQQLLPDPTFGTNGVVIYEDASPTWSVDYPNTMALDQDGSVMMGGAFFDACCFDYVPFILRAKRFTATGEADQTFNLDPTPFSQTAAWDPNEFTDVRDLVFTPEGKLLLLVKRSSIGSPSLGSFFLVRTLANGTLDPTFDSDGRWLQALDFDATLPDTIQFADSSLAVTPRLFLHYNQMAVQPDGKVLVAAQLMLGYGFAGGVFGSSRTIVFRYLPDGGYDTSFDGRGWTYLPLVENSIVNPWGIQLQPDGKILIGSSFAAQSADSAHLAEHHVWRLNPDGSTDTGYGIDGLATLPMDASTFQPHLGFLNHGRVMMLTDDGGLLIGGTLIDGTDRDFGLYKLTEQGVIDAAFGNDGLMPIDFGGDSEDLFTGVGLLPDGRYLAVGSAGGHTAFACFDEAGTLNSGFGSNGLQVTSGDNGGAIRIRPDGRVLLGTYDLSSGSVQMRLEQYVLDNVNSTDDDNARFPPRMFPSPADDVAELVMDAPIQAFSITDAAGRLVQVARSVNAHGVTIDTHNLPDGLYFLRTAAMDKVYTNTLVVLHR